VSARGLTVAMPQSTAKGEYMPIRSGPTTRILVVCTANVIRSPFVAALLRTRLHPTPAGPVVVTSAGVSARFGTSAEAQLLDVARVYGLDLSAHRAERLVEPALEGQTVILCAERRHRRAVLRMRPDLVATVFTVREFGRLLEAVREAGLSSTDWPSLVAAAASLRTKDRHVAEGDDGIVDPVSRPPSVWQAFERQSVQAVSSILASGNALPGRLADGGPGGVSGGTGAVVSGLRRALAGSGTAGVDARGTGPSLVVATRAEPGDGATGAPPPVTRREYRRTITANGRRR